MNHLGKSLALTLALGCAGNVYSATLVTQQKDTHLAALSAMTSELGEVFFDTLSSLKYKTAVGFNLYIPSINRNFALDWGFGGAGDPALPLPSGSVKFEEVVHVSFEKPSIQQAATDIARNYALRTAKEKYRELYNFLTKQKAVNPVMVFAIKVALLFRDHGSDITFVREQLLLLMQRLSVTPEAQRYGAQIKPSEFLSEEIIALIDILSPGIISTIDACWKIILSDDADFSVEELIAQDIFVGFKSKEYAEAFAAQTKDATTFAQLEDALDDVSTRYTLGCQTNIVAFITMKNKHENDFAQRSVFVKRIPSAKERTLEELDAAFEFVPGLIGKAEHIFTALPPYKSIVEDECGNFWVVTKATSVEPHEAGILLVSTLAKSYRQFVMTRKNKLALNPDEEKKQLQIMQQEALDNDLAEEFLATAAGAELASKLAESVNAAVKEFSALNKAIVVATADELRELMVQKETLQELNRSLLSLKKLHASDDEIARMETTITRINNRIKELESKTQSAPNTQTPEQKEKLTELYTKMNMLRNSGKAIPADLTEAIARIQASLQKAADTTSSDNYIDSKVIAALAEKLVAAHTKIAMAAEALDEKSNKGARIYAKMLRTKAKQISAKVELIERIKLMSGKKAADLTMEEIMQIMLHGSCLRHTDLNDVAQSLMYHSSTIESLMHEFVTAPEHATLRAQLQSNMSTIIRSCATAQTFAGPVSSLLSFFSPEASLIFKIAVK